MKTDRDLLRRVVVVLESGRDIDVDTLLQRELSPIPLSLATPDGNIRSASSKADLSNILQENVAQTHTPSSQDKTCTIIDEMAAVQSLANRSGAKAFGEWCDNFLKYIFSHFSSSCTRVGVVFDRYLDNSIKGGTRTKRKGGKQKGIRKNVESKEQKIGKWERFIAVDKNKASLTNFLSTEISRTYHPQPGRGLVLSGGFLDILEVWSSCETRDDFSGLASNHEEADTRIVLHARDATDNGYEQVNVICHDTDVLILLLAHGELLCPTVWMFSGTVKRKKYIPVHRIPLPDEKRSSLLAFHAVTGCDTVSQFAGIGKQSAWKTFHSCSPELLQRLGDNSPPDEKVLSEAEALYARCTTTAPIKFLSTRRDQQHSGKQRKA